jgi:hypothetical protein
MNEEKKDLIDTRKKSIWREKLTTFEWFCNIGELRLDRRRGERHCCRRYNIQNMHPQQVT